MNSARAILMISLYIRVCQGFLYVVVTKTIVIATWWQYDNDSIKAVS
jgi:hypothetical protein